MTAMGGFTFLRRTSTNRCMLVMTAFSWADFKAFSLDWLQAARDDLPSPLRALTPCQFVCILQEADEVA
jgi:hypothetical protein